MGTRPRGIEGDQDITDVPAHLKKFAAENREKATDAHRLLVGCLRKMDLGFRIFTEHAVCLSERDVLLDIFLPDLMLAIEVDGGSHNEKAQEDEERDRAVLMEHGILTFRCRNREVFYERDDLLRRIAGAIRRRARQLGLR